MATRNPGIPRIPRDILDEAVANGWKVERGKGDHLKWTNPKTRRIVFSASTPSDRRTWRNHLGALRRALREGGPLPGTPGAPE